MTGSCVLPSLYSSTSIGVTFILYVCAYAPVKHYIEDELIIITKTKMKFKTLYIIKNIK